MVHFLTIDLLHLLRRLGLSLITFPWFCILSDDFTTKIFEYNEAHFALQYFYTDANRISSSLLLHDVFFTMCIEIYLVKIVIHDFDLDNIRIDSPSCVISLMFSCDLSCIYLFVSCMFSTRIFVHVTPIFPCFVFWWILVPYLTHISVFYHQYICEHDNILKLNSCNRFSLCGLSTSSALTSEWEKWNTLSIIYSIVVLTTCSQLLQFSMIVFTEKHIQITFVPSHYLITVRTYKFQGSTEPV